MSRKRKEIILLNSDDEKEVVSGEADVVAPQTTSSFNSASLAPGKQKDLIWATQLFSANTIKSIIQQDNDVGPCPKVSLANVTAAASLLLKDIIQHAATIAVSAAPKSRNSSESNKILTLKLIKEAVKNHPKYSFLFSAISHLEDNGAEDDPNDTRLLPLSHQQQPAKKKRRPPTAKSQTQAQKSAAAKALAAARSKRLSSNAKKEKTVAAAAAASIKAVTVGLQGEKEVASAAVATANFPELLLQAAAQEDETKNRSLTDTQIVQDEEDYD